MLHYYSPEKRQGGNPSFAIFSTYDVFRRQATKHDWTRANWRELNTKDQTYARFGLLAVSSAKSSVVAVIVSGSSQNLHSLNSRHVPFPRSVSQLYGALFADLPVFSPWHFITMSTATTTTKPRLRICMFKCLCRKKDPYLNRRGEKWISITRGQIKSPQRCESRRQKTNATVMIADPSHYRFAWLLLVRTKYTVAKAFEEILRLATDDSRTNRGFAV